MPLIKASEVAKRGSWDGTSAHPQTNAQVPNKETAMDFTEHQNIVADSAKLMVGTGIPEKFDNLRLALGAATEKNMKASIYVSKGIHQPYTNPHLQIQTETFTRGNSGWGNAFIQTYHLNVSAEARPDISGMTDRFSWKGVQYSIGDGGPGERWPSAAPLTMKTREGILGRRNSVSGSEFAARVKQIAVEAAEAKAVEEFNALCEAFEKLHKTKPIDRDIRTEKFTGWTPPIREVQKANCPGVVKFKYSPMSKQLTLA